MAQDLQQSIRKEAIFLMSIHPDFTWIGDESLSSDVYLRSCEAPPPPKKVN